MEDQQSNPEDLTPGLTEASPEARELFRLGHQILSQTWTLPLSYINHHFLSITQLLLSLETAEKILLVDFFSNQMQVTFRARMTENDSLELQELQSHLDRLPQDHPVQLILDSLEPTWMSSFLDELLDAVDRLLERWAQRFHALRLSYLLSLPQKSPPPPHLISHQLPGGPATCSICLSEYNPDSQIIILQCHSTHHFHRRCLSRWVLDQSNCPLCRTPVP